MIRWLFINRSIRTKIVWSSVLISLIPMLVLSMIFYKSSTRSLENSMFRSSNQNAEYLSGYLDQYFSNISSSALQIYGFERILTLMEHGANYNDAEIIQLRESIKNYDLLIQNKNKDIIKIMIFGKDNKLEDSWSRAASYESVKVDQSIPHYKEMLDLPFQQALMFTYTDAVLQQDFFVYSIPIYDPFYRTKFGSLVFYIQGKELTKMIEANNHTPNVIVLQNSSGEPFYQTNTQYANIVPKYAKPEISGQNDPKAIQFSKTKDLLVGTSRLNYGNMALSIVYPNPELEQNRRNILLTTLVAFIFVMLSIALLSILAQHYITRPIKLLGKAMKAVRKGNFHVSLQQNANYRDDISELTGNFNFMTDKIRELIESEYEMQLLNKEAQILALQMQINPHFLYNTLQAIGGKAVLIGDYEIHEMCRALGDMFRYSFYEGNVTSTIGQELVHVNNYLYIQQLRFEETLQIELDVSSDLMDCAIIRFVMQPIIENVIVHAFSEREEEHPLRIGVSVFREDDAVVLAVQDNGPGIENDKLMALRSSFENKSTDVFYGVSIGLKNVHERIRLVYGPPFGLDIESEIGLGTTIRIRIPYNLNGGDSFVQSHGRG
ncbi:two-component sensor histidine kinase [Paenibacillus pectinilyticus]|uniref:histidine kinase n=1 Tax=Paenibacillus pectinilyticus TaxID=512399 RepID=A0A1C0ZRF1_9BACL|nr:sensor histidine kinase [Paenibacillus pectinilyticus]OCT10634.1 two-component sensor histidine kinase [Paenibacillus pectinilyticus]